MFPSGPSPVNGQRIHSPFTNRSLKTENILDEILIRKEHEDVYQKIREDFQISEGNL